MSELGAGIYWKVRAKSPAARCKGTPGANFLLSLIFMVSRGKSERDRKEMLRNLRSYLLVALLIALFALSKFTKITDGLEKYYEMMDEAENVTQKFLNSLLKFKN